MLSPATCRPLYCLPALAGFDVPFVSLIVRQLFGQIHGGRTFVVFQLNEFGVVAGVCLFWGKILNQTGPPAEFPWCGADTEVVSVQKLSILSALAAALFISAANAQVREADITGGRVTGVSSDDVVSFKGIPFAAPPVGPLRWRSPQPAKAWAGVKEASSFAAGCIQNAAFTGRFGAPPALSEDCLYLNVWTPQKRPTTNCL
jgi:hypothetical protein